MTFKFNFQACGCLLCFAMFQQFYKLEIQNSENPNNALICFAAVPMCTLSFCKNLLTNFNAWAPAVPVLVLRPESICADTEGWALGTEGQDSPPRMLALPLYHATLYPRGCSCCLPLLLQLGATDQGQVPDPSDPRLPRRYTCVCLAIGPTAWCQAPGLSLLLICLFPSSPRTCLQNASVKMKLSKLSWWQPQSINHTQ